jgi:hypothetical protein
MGNPFGSNDGDKKNPDGVNTYPADAHDIETYAKARQELSQLSAPILLSKSNPHERLFVAAFDGTGNSMVKDPEHLTNVAQIVQQIQAGNKTGNTQIQVGYVEGTGTQNNVITRALDGAQGYTYDERLEQMYVQFTQQAAKWLKEDPNAQIRVADIGFSRGAEQAASFSRLVEERGIQDPSGAKLERNFFGHSHIEYTKPPLVEPGQITQAVGLFDPVGTGSPRDHDRRLPPSVISGFQITAEDERRNLFKSTNIIDPGMNENNHFLNVTVGGAHSNIGGGYSLNGLAVRNGNLMTDYLNSLSDTPFLQKQAVPAAPEKTVVHRSEEHQFFYRTSDFDKTGERIRIEEVAPKSEARNNGVDINNKESRDEAMAKNFTERKVPIAAEPISPEAKNQGASLKTEPTQPSHPDDKKLHIQSTDAVRQLDEQMGRVTDHVSVRLAASLTVLAKDNEMQVHKAMFSDGNGHAKAGENVIILEIIGNGDPASYKKASMPTQLAINTPVEESFKKMDIMNSPQPAQDTQKIGQALSVEVPEAKAISR